MKVIFSSRKDCLTSMGGDTIQMLKTQEYLERNHEFESKICLDVDEIYQSPDFEIAHIFNIQTIDNTLELIEACKKSGKKVALSTIYWDLSHSDFTSTVFRFTETPELMCVFKLIKPAMIKLKILRNILLSLNKESSDIYGSKKYILKRRKALMEADILLPNSFEELTILSKEFQIDIEELKNKTVVIPNAVDINQDFLETDNIVLKGELKDVKDYTLTVGRIEVNKNQYSIVKALYDKPEIPIVFIGRVGDGAENKKYAKKLKNLSKARGNVYFIDQIPQEEVYLYYKKAKVHVLPSFRESPGLSSLEAKYFGCEIVTSSKEYCPVDYYQFDKIAHLCNPYSSKSIRKAILEAYNSPKGNFSRAEFFNFYSYDNVAIKMNEVYEQLIENDK